MLKFHPKLDKKFIKTDSVQCSHTYRESLSISNYSVSWSQSNAYFGQFFIVNLHRRLSEYTHSTVDDFDRNFSIRDRMIHPISKNKNVICKLLFSKTQGSMKKTSFYEKWMMDYREVHNLGHHEPENLSRFNVWQLS